MCSLLLKECTFVFLFEGIEIWTLNLNVRELIKLLVYFVTYCNDIGFLSSLKYVSIKSLRFLILVCVLSKSIQGDSQTV